MKERNEYLEADGLYWESETHEWFHDKVSTQHAQRHTPFHMDGLKNIYCFVVRNKENGVYERVIMNSETNEVIFASDSLEVIGFEIDKMKIAKRFN